MTEINNIRQKQPIILKEEEIIDVIKMMTIYLNPGMSEKLMEVVKLSSSIFPLSSLVQTFKGETIKVANYFIFYKTNEFIEKFSNSKYNINKIEEDDEIILQVSLYKIKLLEIKLKNSNVEFEFFKVNSSRDELLNKYQKEMRKNVTKENLEKLQNIISLGDEFKEINEFFNSYTGEIGLDLDDKSCDWCTCIISSIG